MFAPQCRDAHFMHSSRCLICTEMHRPCFYIYPTDAMPHDVVENLNLGAANAREDFAFCGEHSANHMLRCDYLR